MYHYITVHVSARLYKHLLLLTRPHGSGVQHIKCLYIEQTCAWLKDFLSNTSLRNWFYITRSLGDWNAGDCLSQCDDAYVAYIQSCLEGTKHFFFSDILLSLAL